MINLSHMLLGNCPKWCWLDYADGTSSNRSMFAQQRWEHHTVGWNKIRKEDMQWLSNSPSWFLCVGYQSRKCLAVLMTLSSLFVCDRRQLLGWCTRYHPWWFLHQQRLQSAESISGISGIGVISISRTVNIGSTFMSISDVSISGMVPGIIGIGTSGISGISTSLYQYQQHLQCIWCRDERVRGMIL